jgi:hypothetical protein
MNPDWPFDQAPNVAAMTTLYVTNRNAPILLVVHYRDDHSWGFFDGGVLSIKNGMMVSMQYIVQLDASVREIADLAPGWVARREHVGGQWVREQNLDE